MWSWCRCQYTTQSNYGAEAWLRMCSDWLESALRCGKQGGWFWGSLWCSMFYGLENQQWHILTNDQAASGMIAADLESDFQSTFKETNDNVYLGNVRSLCGGNVISVPLQMFHRSVLLGWRNEADIKFVRWKQSLGASVYSLASQVHLSLLRAWKDSWGVSQCEITEKLPWPLDIPRAEYFLTNKFKHEDVFWIYEDERGYSEGFFF